RHHGTIARIATTARCSQPAREPIIHFAAPAEPGAARRSGQWRASDAIARIAATAFGSESAAGPVDTIYTAAPSAAANAASITGVSAERPEQWRPSHAVAGIAATARGQNSAT